MNQKALVFLFLVLSFSSPTLAGTKPAFDPAPYFPKNLIQDHVDLVVDGVLAPRSGAVKNPRISGSEFKDLSLLAVHNALRKAMPPSGAGLGPDEEWQSYAEVVLDAGRAYETATSYCRLIGDLRELKEDAALSSLCEYITKKLASGPTKYDGVSAIPVYVDSLWDKSMDRLEMNVKHTLRKNHQGNLWLTYEARHRHMDVRTTPGQPFVVRDQDEDMLFALGPYVIGQPPKPDTETDRGDPFFVECQRILRDVSSPTELSEPKNEVAQAILVHVGIAAEHYKNTPQTGLFLRITCEQAELERLTGHKDRFTRLLDRIADVAVAKCAHEQAAMLLYTVGQYYLGILELDAADRLFVRASEAAPDTLPGYAARLGTVLCMIEVGDKKGAISHFGKVFEEKWHGDILVPCYEPIAETSYCFDAAAQQTLFAYRALTAEPSYKSADYAQTIVIEMAHLLHDDALVKVEIRRLLEKYPDSPYVKSFSEDAPRK